MLTTIHKNRGNLINIFIKSFSGSPSPGSTEILPLSSASVKILVRKEVGNPRDYFDKSYEEYKEGFAARGVFKKYIVDDII